MIKLKTTENKTPFLILIIDEIFFKDVYMGKLIADDD